MIYAGVALCILIGGALWLYATNQRRTAEHVNAELAAPAYDPEPPRRQPQTVAPMAYQPVVVTETPTGTARSLQSDVAVPMAQAGFTGIVGAILAAMLAANLRLDGVLSWALGGFALGLAGVWGLNLWQSNRLLVIHKVERFTGHDLDGDGYEGAPPANGAFTVNRDAASAKVKKIVRAQAQADTLTAYLQFWTRCFVQGGGTAYRKQGVKTVGSPEYQQWDAIRRELVRWGLLAWKRDEEGSETHTCISMEDGRQIILDHLQPK